MSHCRRVVAQVVCATSLAAACLSGLATSAWAADAVPFSDPAVNGYLGFCDQSGHQVTSGSLGAVPFAWTIVSSQAAPQAYSKGKATVNAYQPRKDIDPGEWSGKQMTGSSTFSNPKHPMSAATYADHSLQDFAAAFPPDWDGLVQIRMYFSGYGLANYSGGYPAAVLKIEGERWRVVQGGDVDCHAGTAVSNETVALPEDRVSSPRPGSNPSAAPSSSPGSISSTSTDPADGAGAEAALSTSSSTTWPYYLIGAAAAALIAALGLTRTRKTGSTSHDQ